ncbi:MAG: DUF488 domain-containing protein [Dehalococcoidia bacterium]|nr:DUF488 domain-containing protein [Dehalococcoidia bacterium]
MNTVLTIGHSTRPLEQFIEMLRSNGAGLVVDVRTIPRSRRNPQFNSAALEEALLRESIGYCHRSGLGGLRRPRPDSPNLGWRSAGFRGFADHMQTAEFRENLEELIALAESNVPVLMCAEALPWRCHRRLIADALCVQGVRVEHIMGGAARRLHSLTPFACLVDDGVFYPPGSGA